MASALPPTPTAPTPTALTPAAMPPREGRLRLRTLVLIRWIALIGQGITLAVVYFGLGYAIPFVPAMAVIAASGAPNVMTSIARPTATWVSDDRKSVGEGTSVSVRVASVGRRQIQKKNKQY